MITPESKLDIDPNEGTLFVLVFKWLHKLLCVFESPSIDFDIRSMVKLGTQCFSQ